MAQSAVVNSSNGSIGGSASDKDILFKPEQLISKEVYVDVADNEIRVLGNILADHAVRVYHVYNAPAKECNDIPELPVYTDGGCAQLQLSNVEETACLNGRRVVNELWLRDKGRYRLEYVHPTVGATEIPVDVYIWTTQGPKINCCDSGRNGYAT